jgi:hypothetical protein
MAGVDVVLANTCKEDPFDVKDAPFVEGKDRPFPA